MERSEFLTHSGDCSWGLGISDQAGKLAFLSDSQVSAWGTAEKKNDKSLSSFQRNFFQNLDLQEKAFALELV